MNVRTRRQFLKDSARHAATLYGLPAMLPAMRPGATSFQQALAPAALQTPGDPRLSPFTGYTRRHWLEITERLLAGVLPYFDAQTGFPELKGVPGDRAHAARYSGEPLVAKLRAIEGIMLLAVYYTAATGRDRVPGYSGSITQPIRIAIARMTDPADPMHPKRTGPAVFMGPEIAFAILLSPKFFWDHGALHANGVLEVGYRGANTVVAENYITDGLPYFAAHGMSGLLIPPDDPFWTAEEQPMPADRDGGRLVLPGAGLVVRVSPLDGESRLYPVSQPAWGGAQWQHGIKYCQHAYSSYLGWCALGEGGEDLGAGRTGFSVDGKTWKFRDKPVAQRVTADHLASEYPLNSANGKLTTHTLVGDAGEIHLFWHDGPQPLWLHLGGYGIHLIDEQSLNEETTARRVHVRAEGKHSLMELLEGPAGRFIVRVLQPRRGWLHSHLFGGRGVFPYWRSHGPVAAHVPLVFFVDGCRDHVPEASRIRIARRPHSIEIELEGKIYDIPTDLSVR